MGISIVTKVFKNRAKYKLKYLNIFGIRDVNAHFGLFHSSLTFIYAVIVCYWRILFSPCSGFVFASLVRRYSSP